MNYKKTMLVISLILCILFSVSCAFAGDLNEEVITSDNQETSTATVVEEMDNIDDGTLQENEDVLTANPKTFTDLNTKINGNDDSEVYLDGNYTYELGTDDAFKDGVVINRAVTVHGNGFTLDGDNTARIFIVTNDNVVFKDIVFVNGKATNNGGAIKGGCTAINCTFNHNLASSEGGAMYGGSAVNCTFNSNSASYYGGAIYHCSAENCTFNSNYASNGGAMYAGYVAVNCTFISNSGNYGGAIYYCSVENCTFISNSAYNGGAIYQCSAENCTFISNYASNGGAMYDSSALVCIFKNNTARYDGGAMYGDGYTATNCQFTNNTAKRNGGAAYQITANNCNFTENTATEYGGAMYMGAVSNSNITQNHANKEGGGVYGSLVANCLFECNSAENGGAMSRGRATNCTFNNNNATNYGGAVYSAKLSTNSEFNNNIALNGTETDNVTWFDPANSKSFFDLNELINNNTDADIYLNNNYTFDLTRDADFKEGITIGRAVTVHGNGFTLDGDNTARIFIVTNDNVVFKDIVFVNGKATNNGGAIKGGCTAINCTFNHNLASSEGGAMYGGSAVNCTFNSNSASYYGGAIFECSAVNCTFNSNYASNGGAMYAGYVAVNCTFISNSGNYGGAIYYCSVENCTFISNSAYNGGAIYQCSAENCTFISNYASNGGAMYDSSALVCIFKNNTARYDGGAMYGDGYTATNCQFTNNTAKRNGGAAYQITANNCNFTENTATEYGGAMYEGTANNCVFKDNKAGISGDNTYNTNVPKPNLIVYNFTSTYDSGDKLLFNFTTASGQPINNANITIRVYKNNALVGTYYALSGEGWVVELDAGSYIAVCSVENQAYEVDPANATLTISKANTKVTSAAVSTVYNNNKNLVVTLKDSQGKPISDVEVSINIGGIKKLNTDKNGQVKFNVAKLVPKTYTAKITFNGNNNYKPSSASVKVTVKKAKAKITAKKKTFKRKVKTKKYTITLKNNVGKAIKKAKVTIKINKKTYPAKTNAKGKATFKIKKLTKKGKYSAVVTYKGNKYYNKATKKTKIIVK